MINKYFKHIIDKKIKCFKESFKHLILFKITCHKSYDIYELNTLTKHIVDVDSLLVLFIRKISDFK